jgi:choline kinase
VIGMVLAAGAGRRLRPYTDTLPKALVPVDDDTTILDVSLRNFAEVDLRDVVIVVGYAADAVAERRAALQRRHGVRIELVHNDKAEIWNNAYSMWVARDVMLDGALMVNGDTVHPVGVEEALLAARGPELLLALDVEKPLAEEEMKVQVDDQRDVTLITKLMDPATAYGEYIGATLIEGSVVPRLADALQATFERDPDLYYEDGYQELVRRGERVATTPIPTGTRWVEVDDHADLTRAREIACQY